MSSLTGKVALVTGASRGIGVLLQKVSFKWRKCYYKLFKR